MRRLLALCPRTALATVAVGVLLSSAHANAAVTLFDRDGWTFQTTGLVGANYQLIKGDTDPLGKMLVGGRINDTGLTGDQRDNKITLSDIRSGFIGTQIGFGLARQISQDVHVDSLLAGSVNGINSNRGLDTAAPKSIDYREAWAQIVSPYGTLRFGRMFGLFGSGSASVVAMAYTYGVGHPCTINAATIACGSVGAGPLYAGFDGAIRYISPRIAGFQFQLSIVDPDVTVKERITPYPRIDADINYDQTFGAARLRLSGQSMFNRIYGNPDTMTIKALTAWGVMGTGILDVGPVSVGGGAWTGKGIGERIPLEAPDPSNPLFEDQNGNLRSFLGVYGNAQVNFQGTSVTVGGGELFVKLTDLDLSMNTPTLTLTDQYEGHITITHKFADCIIAEVEYMHWHTDWQVDPGAPAGMDNPKQSLNFMGGGINYIW